MPRRNEVTDRQAKRRLVQKERLRATKGRNYSSALRWYNAHQALATPGADVPGPALGEVIVSVATLVEGQKSLVRWHDGTITSTWISRDKINEFTPKWLTEGTYVVAVTGWSETREGPWLEERLMYVSNLVDVITKDVLSEYNAYWAASRELDEIEMNDLLMVAPVTDPTPTASRGPGPRYETPPVEQLAVSSPNVEIKFSDEK